MSSGSASSADDSSSNNDKAIHLASIAKMASSLSINSNSPSIQTSINQVDIDINSLSNPTAYADARVFSGDFKAELDFVRKIELLVEFGAGHVQFLYCYRSISRAIPEIQIEVRDDMNANQKDQLTAKKREYNSAVIDTIRPGMLKLKELISFVSQSITIVHDCIVHLIDVDVRGGTISEGLYSSVIKLIDVLVKLDNLKDIKTSIKNDLNRYKRSVNNTQNMSPDIMEELSIIQDFLSNQKKARNYIFLSLKDEIKVVMGYEDILINLGLYCCNCIENNIYVTPDEKFELIRVLPHLLLLADGDSQDSQKSSSGSCNVFKKYKSKLGPIQKIIVKYPVVPLFGDMTITAIYILERASNFDEATMKSLWTNPSDDIVTAGYDIVSYWPSIRAEFEEYSTNWATHAANLKKTKFMKDLDPNMIELASNSVGIVANGISMISSWSSKLLMMMAWKYTHPNQNAESDADMGSNISATGGGGEFKSETSTMGMSASQPSEYAQALRDNLSIAEKTAVADLIGMIKSTSSMICNMESELAPLIRFYTHHIMQQFVQGDMLPLLHRVDKRRKDLLPSLLVVRNMVSDWLYGCEPIDNYKSYSRNDGKVSVKHPARVVSASFTQLLILRAHVRSIYDEKSPFRKKQTLLGKSEMESIDVQIFEEFYSASFYFPYFLSLGTTVRTISDLSDLWYREFFLEVTKAVQFPIDMSFPWMITEFIISSQTNHVPFVENIMYSLDIYNDVAQRALYVLKQQHLYDEIEAEGNLVLDQLVYLVAEEVYTYYKSIAVSSNLDPVYKDKLEEIKGARYLMVKKRRYDALLAQKAINVLGRSINLSFIIGQHVNKKFYDDVKVSLIRFESCDLTGIVEFKSAIDVLRSSHEFLSEHLQLDPFDNIFHNVNETHVANSFSGRLNFHIFSALVVDVFANHSYNYSTHRFVRSPIQMKSTDNRKSPKQSRLAQVYGSSNFFKPFEYWHRLSRGYVGKAHWDAILSLSSWIDLPMIIDESLKNISEKLEDFCKHVDTMMDKIPASLSLVRNVELSTAKTYAFFEEKLGDLFEFELLKQEVFQSVREIGNTIAFFQDLSDCLDSKNGVDYLNQGSYVGVPPSCTSTCSNSGKKGGGGEQDAKIKADVNRDPSKTALGSILSHSNLKSLFSSTTSNISKDGLDLLSSITTSSISLLINKSLAQKSLFRGALLHLENILYQHNLYNDWSKVVLPEKGKVPAEQMCGISLDIDRSKSFYKLWSALNFLFCLPTIKSDIGSVPGEDDEDEDDQISDEEQFGHGFVIAGSTLVFLLQQRVDFERTDMVRRVIEVDDQENDDPVSKEDRNADVDPQIIEEAFEFVENARNNRNLQGQIFNLLASNFSPDDGSKYSKKKAPMEFQPEE